MAATMEKQVVIEVKGGIVQHIKTNFECSVQIIDYDNEPDHVGDVLEPDQIVHGEDILVPD